ncbi:unnamed protein product [Moneuplotes crassus]|uniref:Uncharacterized protein n=1 Tax=Euplotes crassus TaxID=5936 RepID=A0AAD1XNM5_EUPCR|nr:unnamed protein product [Moneuplotes crassus]
MIGRSKDKLEKSEKRVQEANKSIQIKILVVDLAETIDVGFYNDVSEKIKNLDVSILVNNAGWGEACHFDDITLDWHLSNLRVNSGAPIMLTYKLINHFLARKSKSAIVNVSSATQDAPIPFMGVYPGSKRYLAILSYYLKDNYGDKIDIQDLTPGFVTTKIVNHYEGRDSISPEKCVQCSIRDLGQEFTCMPVPAHSFAIQLFHTLYRFCHLLFKILISKEERKELSQ